MEFRSGMIMNNLFIICGMEDPSGLVYVGTDKTIVVTDQGVARHFMAFVAYRYNVRKDKEVKTWEVFGDFLNVKHLTWILRKRRHASLRMSRPESL